MGVIRQQRGAGDEDFIIPHFPLKWAFCFPDFYPLMVAVAAGREGTTGTVGDGRRVTVTLGDGVAVMVGVRLGVMVGVSVEVGIRVSGGCTSVCEAPGVRFGSTGISRKSATLNNSAGHTKSAVRTQPSPPFSNRTAR